MSTYVIDNVLMRFAQYGPEICQQITQNKSVCCGIRGLDWNCLSIIAPRHHNTSSSHPIYLKLSHEYLAQVVMQQSFSIAEGTFDVFFCYSLWPAPF